MKNFRPVSNLSFLSKLLERVVLCRLQAFLDSNDMMPPMQSVYRRFHSTETAVTTVYSNLLLAADVGQVSALCLLDLTAAFDTVDHQLLLHRLERQFGLRSVVLTWFASYLTDRSFRVLFDGGHMSAEVSVLCLVPQGSVLGPRLFVLYMADLTDVVAGHNVKFHGYADDSSNVRSLSASQHSVYHFSSWSVRCRHRPLDGSKSSADESHQDRVAVGRL